MKTKMQVEFSTLKSNLWQINMENRSYLKDLSGHQKEYISVLDSDLRLQDALFSAVLQNQISDLFSCVSPEQA